MTGRTILGVALVAAPLAAQQPPVADSLPARIIAEGKRIFEGKSGGALCFSCHAVNGTGYPGGGPNLTDSTWLHGDGSLAFIERLVRTGVPTPRKSAVPMPPMGGAQLDDAQVKAVAAYVYSLSRKP